MPIEAAFCGFRSGSALLAQACLSEYLIVYGTVNAQCSIYYRTLVIGPNEIFCEGVSSVANFITA